MGGVDDGHLVLGVCGILSDCPRTRLGKAGAWCGWWTDELEGMKRDVRFMRNTGTREQWALTRKVYWNSIVQARYDWLGWVLAKTGDPAVFRLVNSLEGRK